MMSDVLGSQFSATECELNCPPLPANLTDRLSALLAIVSVPATLPIAQGVNVTFSAAVCPGGTIVFAPTPLALKPEPVTSTPPMIAISFPVFVSIIPSESVLSTSTFPKSKVPALALRTGPLLPEVLDRVTAPAQPLVSTATARTTPNRDFHAWLPSTKFFRRRHVWTRPTIPTMPVPLDRLPSSQSGRIFTESYPLCYWSGVHNRDTLRPRTVLTLGTE